MFAIYSMLFLDSLFVLFNVGLIAYLTVTGETRIWRAQFGPLQTSSIARDWQDTTQFGAYSPLLLDTDTEEEAEDEDQATDEELEVTGFVL